MKAKIAFNPVTLYRDRFMFCSNEGTNWEEIWLPENSHPFSQCRLFGSYYEAGSGIYMSLPHYEANRGHIAKYVPSSFAEKVA